MKIFFGDMIAIAELFKGFIILNLILSPLTVLITFFIAVMGGGNASNPNFLRSLGITTGFVYGTPLGLLIWLVIFGKFADFILQIAPLTTLHVSCLGILIAALLFVVASNIFIDNLYQFRQGNYTISFFALLVTLLYVVIVYFSAKITISWLSI
jgi:hypothetical protein